MVKKLFSYRLALKNGAFREGLVLQIGSNFGEIAPLPGFSKETLDDAREETINWIKHGSEPRHPSVRFGIASAQRPLKSVSRKLCALGVKEGFQTMKLKVKGLPIAEAIRFVKDSLGKAELKIDCNRAWSLEEALYFAGHFKPSDFVYLEEPVKTIKELIAFSKKTLFPIALDESIHCNWDEIPSLQAIVVKPTLVGNVPKVPKHLQLILSSSYESGLGLVHIANLSQRAHPLGLDTYDAFKEDLLIRPLITKNGYFSWEATNPPIDMTKLCAL